MMINVSRFCSTLATLLNSGVPILASMKIVKNLISNVHMQRAIENSRINVSEGSSLAAPLEHGVKTEGEQGYPEVHQDNDRSLLGQQVVSVPEESQTEKLSRLACLRYCVLVA